MLAGFTQFLSANAAALALIGFACSIALAICLFFELVKLGERGEVASENSHRGGGPAEPLTTSVAQEESIARAHGEAK